MIRIKLTALTLALSLAGCGTPPTGNAAAGNAVTSAGAAEPSANPITPGPGAPPAPATSENGIAPAPTPTAWPQERYVGHWVGVEGMVLDVATKPGGGVKLAMQYDLDHKGTYDGSVTAVGLRFVRDGRSLTATPSDGDATGLKWLAGKKDCLTVAQGEGYCRD